MISMTVLDVSPFRALLDAEARSAAAARGRIGVGHLERGAAKIFDIIDGAAIDQVQADRVDDQSHTIRFGNAITLLHFAQGEAVGEAGAAAAIDRQAKHGRPALLGSDEGDALRRAGAEDQIAHTGQIRSAA